MTDDNQTSAGQPAKSKKPKRWTPNRHDLRHHSKDGHYVGALVNLEVATALGEFITYWSHVEDRMMNIFRDLFGGDATLPHRQVFRAINVNATRIKVLKALLHEAPMNKDRTLDYDEIIDEFEAISKIRNSYVHGLWYTHDCGTVYIAVASVDEFSFFEKREIGVEEIKRNIERLAALWQRIMRLTVYDRGKLHVGDKS